MTARSLNGIVRHLRTIAVAQTYRARPDQELLERFVAQHDDAAFTVLVERHGPMVLAVCRRALGNRADAEDVCQATFLVLARKAARIRKGTALSGWLHRVACCAAANWKRAQARRRHREHAAPTPAPPEPGAEVSWREVQAVLDEELQALPQRYATPLILCYLDGKTRDEAANELGVSAGTLHGRLERGRQLLRQRLVRRGLTLSAALFATALGDGAAHAALAPTFVVSAAKAALLLAAGQPLPAGLVAGPVRTLTEEVLKTMSMTKLKLGTAAALCAGLLALLGSSFAAPGAAQDPRKPEVLYEQVTKTAVKQESDEEFLRRVSKDLRGTEPTPAELHFFLASKDAGKRQKAIDLFIQERQTRQTEEAARYRSGEMYQPSLALVLKRTQVRTVINLVKLNEEGVDHLHQRFYAELQSANDRGDVARVTQAYLDRLSRYVKDHPANDDTPQAMLQIIRVYEAQGKSVEASAWREKLLKEHPRSAAAQAVK
jgi:RNA polymerase sigma factor (sigma-70 family)